MGLDRDLLDDRVFAGNDSTHGVTVTTKILGCRMNHQIDPHPKRAGIEWSGKGVVDRDRNLPTPRDGCNGLDVKHIEDWIAGTFNINQFGVCPHGLRKITRSS